MFQSFAIGLLRELRDIRCGITAERRICEVADDDSGVGGGGGAESAGVGGEAGPGGEGCVDCGAASVVVGRLVGFLFEWLWRSSAWVRRDYVCGLRRRDSEGVIIVVLLV